MRRLCYGTRRVLTDAPYWRLRSGETQRDLESRKELKSSQMRDAAEQMNRRISKKRKREIGLLAAAGRWGNYRSPRRKTLTISK